MEKLQIKQERPKHIYLVIRVFNIFSSNIGKCIYIDPWSLQGTLLKFDRQGWAVTPA